MSHDPKELCTTGRKAKKQTSCEDEKSDEIDDSKTDSDGCQSINEQMMKKRLDFF